MVAALKAGRDSIGIEIDSEYCRMAARFLKTETSNLFSTAKLRFERIATETAGVVQEDQALYEVQPERNSNRP